jgi:hypothetical protein
MGFQLLRDVLIVLLAGFFGWWGLPYLMGTPAVPAFFLTGIVIALPAATVYALGIMVANRAPQRAIPYLAVAAFALGTWPIWQRGASALPDLLALIPPLLLVLWWGARSRLGFQPAFFRGLWLYGFYMAVLHFGLLKILVHQPYVQPIAFLVAVFYLTLRLGSELLNP